MDEPRSSQRILCQIANSAFEIVNNRLSRDQQFAELLRSTSTTSRQIFGEEGITEEIASTLKERFTDHIDITLFTHPEEKSTGADWYWRIQKPSGAIHARVQAKRIRQSEFGQDDSKGTIQIDVEQLENLIVATDSDQKN